MKSTIKDVSMAAGVSVKTVSRVLNKEKYVSTKLRTQVEDAVAKLHYHPSFAARMLRGRRSFQIALVYDNPDPFYVYTVQEGVRARCAEQGFRMLVQPCSVNSPGLADELGSLIEQTHIDGLILTPPLTDCVPALEELARHRIRTVRISPGTDLMATSSPYIDDVQAAADMTAHLIALGHKRIGFVVGHPGYVVSNQRLQGHREALQSAGLPFDPDLIQPGLFSFQSGFDAGQKLIALDRSPTAIFASNDDMAAGVMAAAYRRGISLPDQLSIAGFDDTELSRSLWPPLTTVHQPMFDIGYAAADLLLSEETEIERRLLPHTLMIRGSTSSIA